MNNSEPTVGFIGAGRAAGALAVGLSNCGYRVAAVASRTHSSAAALAGRIERCDAVPTAQRVADSCDVVFITTPDGAIEIVAPRGGLAPRRWRGPLLWRRIGGHPRRRA